jgi:hypothetical protein
MHPILFLVVKNPKKVHIEHQYKHKKTGKTRT